MNRVSGIVLVSFAAVLLGAGPSLAHEVLYFSGEVAIETDHHGRIIVAVDQATMETPGDGITDHLFILQQEEPGFTWVDERWPAVTLLFTRQELLIGSPADRDSLLLALRSESTANPELRHGDLDLPRPGASRFSPTLRRVEGYGLAHMTVRLLGSAGDIASRFTREGPARLFAGAGHGGEEGSTGKVNCKAGGCGATSCSVSNCGQFLQDCSVNCSSGFNACCNCGSCSCFSQSQCAGN